MVLRATSLKFSLTKVYIIRVSPVDLSFTFTSYQNMAKNYEVWFISKREQQHYV
jgi:hypothetical protein